MKRLVLAFIFVISFVAPSAFCCTVVVVTSPIELPRNFRVALTNSAKPLQMKLSVLDHDTGRLIRQVSTDVYGKAEIRNLNPGMYRITSPVSDEIVKVTAKKGVGDLRINATFDREPIEVASVSGTITDITGAVIPGANAVLERLDTFHSPEAVGTSDASGSVLLKAQEGGVYILRVANKGFQTAVVPLRITRAGWSGFTLTLQVGTCSLQSAVPFTITPKK